MPYRPPGCKKLKGEDELWRIRVGDYRVVDTVEDEKLIVLVVRWRIAKMSTRGDSLTRRRRRQGVARTAGNSCQAA